MPAMPKFNLPGQVHFVTTNTYHRIPLFLTHDTCRVLLNNLDFYRRKDGFRLIGYVIMPDHLHALIVPDERNSIQRILQDIKRYSAKQILELIGCQPNDWRDLGGMIVDKEHLRQAYQTSARRCLENLHVPRNQDFIVASPRTKNQQHQIWQESFYDFNVFSTEKLAEKLNYIHLNPIRWKLVNDPFEYPYSSYLNFYTDASRVPIEVDWLN